jgi:3-hydroxyisobutyrate dehydrogenase-like beta-hydroxyacid dehydrogenase
MGAALAAAINGEVLWSSEGRSEATAVRAEKTGILDVETLESLVDGADAIISVCPPAAAVGVAGQVSAMGFAGLYVDVNAISPSTSREIGRRFSRFVDGGIVGPPPLASHSQNHSAESDGASNAKGRPDGTRLYLSGPEASAVAALFAGSDVDARQIGSEPGQASALKMAYAAWTKGTSALLLSVAALAASEGVTQELFDEWDMSIPELAERLERLSARIGEKAWRFVGEMEEIASSYSDAGLPDGFHLAAADLYGRLAKLKEYPAGQMPDEIVNMLLDRSSGP